MENSNSNSDDWLAIDKLEHILFCFTISLTLSLLLSRSHRPFLRRRHVIIGSIFSVSAGAAKELADHLGFFGSSGASAKDAAADLVGVVIAAFVVKWLQSRFRPNQAPRRLEIV